MFEKLAFFNTRRTKQSNLSPIIYGCPLPSNGYYIYDEEGLIYEFEYSPIHDHLVDRLRREGWRIRLYVKIGGYLRYQVVYG